MSDYSRDRFSCEWQSAGLDRQRVVVRGEIDIATGPCLGDALREAQARARHVVLDLERTTFIDTSGARILLAAHAHAHAVGGSFAIAGTRSVIRLLRLVGADRVLAVERPSPLLRCVR